MFCIDSHLDIIANHIAMLSHHLPAIGIAQGDLPLLLLLQLIQQSLITALTLLE